MHNIYLYKDLSGDTFDWDVAIDMFKTIKVNSLEELRESLIKENVGSLDLKYLDTNNKNQSIIEDINIIVWDLNDTHFDWLVKEELGRVKFIEIGENEW